MIWRATDPQGNEAGKVKYDIVQYTRGAVLDLGCGPSKAFPHFVGVDSKVDTELFGIQMDPDVEDDCTTLSKFEDGQCDAVFSSHLLEHIVDTELALRNWWRVIKVGGYLVLYLPHVAFYPNVGEPGANPDHKHDFSPEDVLTHIATVAAEAKTGMDIIVNEERNGGTEYSFLLVVQKLGEFACNDTYKQPRPEKTVCVVRYGGFGDMLQAANILPQLKREGYHVTFMTTPKGQEILRHDPHIDDWFIQDDNQVPNHELPYFWQAAAKKFDRFIQLSESVEGTLLALPGRANHAWPDAVRRVELNKNYLEWTAALAELEYHSDARFYPTPAEGQQVCQYLYGVDHEVFPRQNALEIGRAPFFIMWALAGSSVHKFTPWMDNVIARVLMEMPEAIFILTGDYACQILEQGWEAEKRVRCESGNMPIRATLAMAQQVNCVVGPETGVLNAVAFDEVPKVIMLSHSSKENLTKHWRNVVTLEPVDTPCYPCHRLHYGREFCHEHIETGAAMCQVNIEPDRIFGGIARAYDYWRNAK